MGIRSKGSRFLVLVALAGFLAQAGTAAAKSTYLTSFRTTYPTAVGSRIDSCLVCHTTTNASPSTRNVYGTAYGNANHSFTAIDAADTDGDGYTNQVEITQFFFPGNAADHPVAGTLPTVTIAATDATATEAGATTGQYTLTRTGATTAALTVTYTVAGTATAGSDYTVLSGSVQIPAGAATATVTVTPIDDLLVETDETVVATLGANAAYTVGAAASATVTIQSDDVLPTVTIAATDPTATEAGPTTGQYTLTRTGATTAALTVSYTVGGDGDGGERLHGPVGERADSGGCGDGDGDRDADRRHGGGGRRDGGGDAQRERRVHRGGGGERDRDDPERRCASDGDNCSHGSDCDGGRADDGAVHADAHRGDDRGADGELHRCGYGDGRERLRGASGSVLISAGSTTATVTVTPIDDAVGGDRRDGGGDAQRERRVHGGGGRPARR